MNLIAPRWVAALRARSSHPDLVPARRALDAACAAHHASLPPIPKRQAGHYHDFFCPRHAVQLRFDPHDPHSHACPVDGEIFRGEPFDSAWRWSVNDLLSDAALRLALRSALIPSDTRGSASSCEAARDARCALEILLGYAERYHSMPAAPLRHPDHPGVVTWSGLDESVWIIRMTWASSLLAERLSPADDQRIREGLLRPAAAHLRSVRLQAIHNITCWNNAAIATLALALGDEEALASAMEPPYGMRAQLTRGIGADGLWWEGSLSYHYYTLAALVWHARSLRASGREPDDGGALYRMFRAPIGIAFPDLTLPAINDCWYLIGLTGEVGHGIPSAAGFYETASSWYADPAFARVLAHNHARRPRAALEALLDGVSGVAAAPAPEPEVRGCRVLDAGVVNLRSPEPCADQTSLLLKAGPSGGRHGHPDQLSIQLFSSGSRLIADLGTQGYGVPLNDTWYRQTASHATVLVDETSQPLTAARIDACREDGSFTEVHATVRWDQGAYAGVRMRRIILWRSCYFVDVFLIECASCRQIDWLLPCLGAPEGGWDVAGEPLPHGLPGACGYQHLTGVRRMPGPGAWPLRWRRDGARLDVYLPPDPGEQRFICRAPSNPASETQSLLVRRRWAGRTLFLALFAPSAVGRDPLVHGVDWGRPDHASCALVVQTPTAVERWQIGLDSGSRAALSIEGA